MKTATSIVRVAPDGSPVTLADTLALRENSALLTVKSMVVSVPVVVPAVSTAAATTKRVPGSTYSYVEPCKIWLDVAPLARVKRCFTNGILFSP